MCCQRVQDHVDVAECSGNNLHCVGYYLGIFRASVLDK